MKKPMPALLIVDMFSRFDFPEADLIQDSALSAAKAIARLRQRFKDEEKPVIYANDNFANWQMDFKELVQECLVTDGISAKIATLLRPSADDYFVLKPKHSAFLATPLAVLLAKLGCNQLVVCGMAADSCIASTCFDSNSREYETVLVPEAVAGIGARKARALQLLEDAQAARLVPIERYLR
ncbi:cysteine hydrolase family protein [Stenotrophomonas sp. NPDC101269]|uniref:Isochorismatase family protein n=1 Tax=Stenotrophomonas rhizophila TaxID=216778 RepID=A0A7V7YF20_9GAMM|nr:MULTISPECIES: isochorismatase family cysteine hydrolase [Stenotrophomonas]KAB7629631.1 isochorismatase family protein [Stenotrophomonas rhizophila]